MEKFFSNYFTEASLSDSYIYQELNKSSKTSTTIINAIKTGVALDSSFIQEQIIQCRRSRLSPLVDTVLSAYDKGKIRLIYNKNYRVSTALPFVVMNVKGNYAVYIFISDFSSLSKDSSTLMLEMKKLYTLMEAAYIGLLYYSRPDKFTRSTALIKIFASIYAAMSLRIYNKEFSLSLDKDIYDKVNYTMARFEIERIHGITNQSLIESYAIGCCNNPSQVVMRLVGQEYTSAAISSIKDVIHFTSTLNPKMERLNFRYYFERWISTYGTGATMGIDSFPYFYYILINAILGSFLVNVPTMSEIVKNTKGINVFYPEISKIAIEI